MSDNETHGPNGPRDITRVGLNPAKAIAANADRTAIIDAMCAVQDLAREQIAFYERVIINIEETIETIRAHG